MTDGPQQSPAAPEPSGGGIPPMPEGPVLRFTPGQQPSGATAAGRLAGGEQAWGAAAGSPQPVTDGAAGAGTASPLLPGIAQQQAGAPAPGDTAPPQRFGTPVPPQHPQWAAPAKEENVAPAVLALVCGVLGVVVPFLPLPLDHVRSWIAFPFGVAGLALGIVGAMGRRMKAMAIVGLVLSALALVVGVIMVGNRLM
ncbi:MAG TPA: hypothetical protein VG674_14105 [Amycolatopsis sp.]|nr:hypothetical protein [Amycolatopsis sp.]